MANSGESKAHKSLLHAILAQAAGNLAHLGNYPSMASLALEYSLVATRQLRKAFEEEYVGDFSVMLASVLTLIMAEVNTRFSEMLHEQAEIDRDRYTTDSPEAGGSVLTGRGTSS